MNPKIIVADDFYDIAFPYHESFSKNECLVTDETVNKLSHLTKNNIEVINVSNEIVYENTKNQITANFQSDWIAVIYLALPTNCVFKQGMSFYIHKQTKLENFPDDHSLRIHGWQTMEDLEKSFDVCNINDWKEYMNIFVKYNRLVLFPGNLWHSYGSGFGNDLNTSMIFQKILLKNV